MGAKAVEQRVELAEVGEVANANGAAPDLVLICGPDSAPGGPDLAGAGRILAHRIEVAMDRQDQRAGLGDPEHLWSDGNALG